MHLETLSLQIDRGVARITLKRPDNANAFNPAMAHELLQVAIACDVDATIRVILLDAEGKMFCAGGDLGHFAEAGNDLAPLLKHMTVDLHAAIARLARMRAPVIAAVQGAAAGAGFSLTTACDLVVAARSAKFTLAYTKAGLVPDGSSTYFLPRILGRRRALELMLLNPVLTSEDAFQCGLVTRVVDDDALDAESTALAQQIAQGPTGAYAATKRLLLASEHETLESQMELESAAITEAVTGLEGQEGIAAFLGKRPPRFQQ
ncbi:MAG: enoyl-CoA hydratase-related protein [Acidobacteriota bacterium]|nr:enoyl-CoA hydratase-related protein [Acidobacteriota bacterium]